MKVCGQVWSTGAAIWRPGWEPAQFLRSMIPRLHRCAAQRGLHKGPVILQTASYIISNAVGFTNLLCIHCRRPLKNGVDHHFCFIPFTLVTPTVETRLEMASPRIQDPSPHLPVAMMYRLHILSPDAHVIIVASTATLHVRRSLSRLAAT